MDPPPHDTVMNLLDRFYRDADAQAPTRRTITESALPEPYRGLLAHEEDMTSSLESFFGQPLRLKILGTRAEPGRLCRPPPQLFRAGRRTTSRLALRAAGSRFQASDATRARAS